MVHKEDGAFGQIITAKGDVQMKIPDNLSFEEASTLGVGITTVGQALYQSLKLPLPNEPTTEKSYLLIYGGSTATGSLAIQFAKLSGFTVAVTCSPRNFDYVKSLGAGTLRSSPYQDQSNDVKIYRCGVRLQLTHRLPRYPRMEQKQHHPRLRLYRRRRQYQDHCFGYVHHLPGRLLHSSPGS